ncbi:hypothetical protein EON80_15380 [bacterium]|nr:MAG: hypothetical protein EON80_15380 [bacterium]
MQNQNSLPSAIVAGQASWPLSTSTVQAYVTETGGQLGPVEFQLGDRTVSPFAVAPWSEEEHAARISGVLQGLRGDFFCMPFGGGQPFEGEDHPGHGETANHLWHFESLQENGTTRLHLSIDTKVRVGRVDKTIELRDGQTALYCRHEISGMNGPMNLGHHAMLKFPEKPGSGLLSTSHFTFGQVFPGQFENPEHGGYSMLKAGATFESLESVPTITGETTDLSRYPARRGYEDLVMIQADQEQSLGWTAVVFPEEKYVWFALKDARVLRGTVFWLSNGGRHYGPWSGRHTGVMGLEEVTSYFHDGLYKSAMPNSLNERGFKTYLDLDAEKPTRVNYIMAVAEIPDGFDHVAEITVQTESVTLQSRSGQMVVTPLDASFLELS